MNTTRRQLTIRTPAHLFLGALAPSPGPSTIPPPAIVVASSVLWGGDVGEEQVTWLRNREIYRIEEHMVGLIHSSGCRILTRVFGTRPQFPPVPHQRRKYPTPDTSPMIPLSIGSIPRVSSPYCQEQPNARAALYCLWCFVFSGEDSGIRMSQSNSQGRI